jgi:hypothetical protein
MRRAITITAGLMLGLTAAAGSAAEAPSPSAADAPARLSLKHVPRIEAAPQQGGRYSLKARFAREESAGELREGGDFVLIGRFAKTGVSCDFTEIFSNGFEGN